MHPEGSLDITETDAQEGVTVLAYGMSPGDDTLHAVEDIPVDLAVYIAHGAQLRRERGAQGMLYLDDKHDRWGSRDGRDAEVRRRNDRIRILAERIDPGICVVTDSEIVDAGAAQQLSGPDAKAVLGMYAEKREGRYNVYQTQVVAGWVRWLRAKLTSEGAALGAVLKMGWVADREYDWQADETTYIGGEADHDKGLQALPDLPVRPLYVPPGYMLRRGSRFEKSANAIRPTPAGVAVPYLYQKAGAERLLVRADLGVDTELKKIGPGVVKASLLGTRVFCRAVLGEGLNGELHHLGEHAWAERNQEESDVGMIDETRDHLERALKELRSILA